MGAPKIIDALDNGGPNDLRGALITDYAVIIPDATDPLTYDPRELGVSGGSVVPAVHWRGHLWYRDDTSVAAADEVTCIILLDGGHYLTNDVKFPQTVESRTIATPPDSAGTDPSVIGLAWRIPASATDTWAGHEDDVAMGSARGWQFHGPAVGEVHYVRAEKVFEHYSNDDAWVDGFPFAPADDSVPLSALPWAAASPTLRVQNQTTNTPPGSRITGGTPTVPLGGTSANINDNSTTTTSVTSALGDLSAAATASRIIAQIDYGANKTLTAIEAKQLKLSSGTGSAGVYYSTDGTTWTKLGSDLSLTSTETDFVRTGSVTARYVSLILAQANYSTHTATIGDLNGYDSTIVASIGDAYIIGSAPIGPWAGNGGKIAICETANSFTIYTQQDGDSVYDIAQHTEYRWSAAQSSWLTSAGVWIDYKEAVAGTVVMTPVGTTAYGYSSTAPLNTQRSYTDPSVLSFAAKKAGNRLRFRYSAEVDWASYDSGVTSNVTADQYAVLAIFRDSESSAIVWSRIALPANLTNGNLEREFLSSAPDTATHTYQIYFMVGWGNNSIGPGNDAVWYPITVMNTRFTLEEKAP